MQQLRAERSQGERRERQLTRLGHADDRGAADRGLLVAAREVQVQELIGEGRGVPGHVEQPRPSGLGAWERAVQRNRERVHVRQYIRAGEQTNLDDDVLSELIRSGTEVRLL